MRARRAAALENCRYGRLPKVADLKDRRLKVGLFIEHTQQARFEFNAIGSVELAR